MKKIFITTGPIVALLLSTFTVFGQSQSRENILKDIESKREELSALEKIFLSPSKKDRAAYAAFLSQPDTGLIRLLPRETYETEVYKDNKKALTLRGGGAYYSFTSRSHEYNEFSNISLERGQLSSGFAGSNYGMLNILGDVPLENVSIELPAASILAAHIPDNRSAQIAQLRSNDGVTIEGLNYRTRVPLKVDSTYLLRSVNYSASDALVAFRVVRLDTDGSAIILWKFLKKYPVPQYARN
jgi:hypothetical protein